MLRKKKCEEVKKWKKIQAQDRSVEELQMQDPEQKKNFIQYFNQSTLKILMNSYAHICPLIVSFLDIQSSLTLLQYFVW